MADIHQLRRCMCLLRTAVSKKPVPAYWLEFFLLVAETGEEGITTLDAGESIGMTPGIASRTVKLLSKYTDETGKLVGPDLFVIVPDHIHRQRMRIFLSKNGKKLAAKLAALN